MDDLLVKYEEYRNLKQFYYSFTDKLVAVDPLDRDIIIEGDVEEEL